VVYSDWRNTDMFFTWQITSIQVSATSDIIVNLLKVAIECIAVYELDRV